MVSKRQRGLFYIVFILLGGLFLLQGCGEESQHRFIQKSAFKGKNDIVITFAAPVDETWAKDKSNYRVYEKPDPDIRLEISSISLSPDKRTVVLHFDEELNQNQPHVVTIKNIRSQGKNLGTAVVRVKKLYLGFLFSIFIGAMLIHNFVFTKYLGLCVFFGTSQKKSTAVGMGVTFTIVMVVSAMMSWLLYQFVLKPYHLDYLQIIVFIGLVSLSVQAVDTILRKINPMLFKAFGVYLVLVIANCIILAVPLILADNEYNAAESFMLALGAGLGFLVALFLMSSVRERLELANVPPTYRGLPIAFVVAGLFALAFLGFSGMSIF
ncbi:MAG: NADH-quinone reductase [Deltaproteobacteria bacterium]|nr:NADH-quinone reductase [Deltaproteobacteria bacterium]MBW1927896.1 NADH-quinone reductase [Deltaproteobacteria bacterium]MBW2026829.1 NADH-quinone reductase [Deltaproteobacteria bacterium]MBW2127286.1 NADH-quinone reductase [Deltaproteobacteria bacterium]